MNAKHLCQTDSHYTPKVYLDAVREVLGGVDLDPASSETANETVQATNYFTEDQDGLSQRWYGNVFCNPPGGKRNNQSLPKLFWQKLFAFQNSIDHAIFFSFLDWAVTDDPKLY